MCSSRGAQCTCYVGSWRVRRESEQKLQRRRRTVKAITKRFANVCKQRSLMITYDHLWSFMIIFIHFLFFELQHFCVWDEKTIDVTSGAVLFDFSPLFKNSSASGSNVGTWTGAREVLALSENSDRLSQISIRSSDLFFFCNAWSRGNFAIQGLCRLARLHSRAKAAASSRGIQAEFAVMTLLPISLSYFLLDSFGFFWPLWIFEKVILLFGIWRRS